MTNSPAANFAIGGVLILVAVGSFVFLAGSTAVFIGIGAAIAGAVFLLIGAQGPKQNPAIEPGVPSLDEPHGYAGLDDDWARFDREYGLGDTGYIDPDEPRRNT